METTSNANFSYPVPDRHLQHEESRTDGTFLPPGQAGNKRKANPGMLSISGPSAGRRRARPRALPDPVPSAPGRAAATEQRLAPTAFGVCAGSTTPEPVFTRERAETSQLRGCFRAWHVFRRQQSGQPMLQSQLVSHKPPPHLRQLN